MAEHTPSTLLQDASDTAAVLQGYLHAELARPKILIICGSGLGGLADAVCEPRVEIEYEKLPGFPVTTGKSFMGLLDLPPSKTPLIISSTLL